MPTSTTTRMHIRPEELAEVKRTASWITRNHYNSQYKEELISELYVWLCEHYSVVERYRTEDGGKQKLMAALGHAGRDYLQRDMVADNPHLAQYDNKDTLQHLRETYNSPHINDIQNYINQHPASLFIVEALVQRLPEKQLATRYGLTVKAVERKKAKLLLELKLKLYM